MVKKMQLRFYPIQPLLFIVVMNNDRSHFLSFDSER